MIKKAAFIKLLLIVCLPIAVLSQHAPSTEDVLSRFAAARWPDRAEALQQLMQMPGVLKSSDVRDALIALQEKENVYIRTYDPSTLGDVPMSEEYGDEYTTNLAGALKIVADEYHDGRAVSALAASFYNPDSPFASWIADQKDAVPRLMTMLTSDPPVTSGNAAYVLATMIDRDRRVGSKGVRSYTVMDPATRQRVITSIRAALADTHPYKRDWLINSLLMVGDHTDVILLQSLAKTDPNFDRQSSKYWQRDHAASAAAKLQARLTRSSQ